jgi:hypothetical protein
MKVYTEVNYIWKDDKLVQTDSQSFDYEGEVTQCHTRKVPYTGVNIPHAHGGEAGKITAEVTKTQDKATNWAKRNNMDKPGGDVKRFTDWGASLDDKGQRLMWGHSSYDDNTPAPPGSEEELLKGSRRGNQGKGKFGKTKEDDLRRTPYAMKSDTLLTQGKYAKQLA